MKANYSKVKAKVIKHKQTHQTHSSYGISNLTFQVRSVSDTLRTEV